MLPPLFTVEKCEKCKRIRILMGGFLKSEWKCPSCGHVNKKQLPPLTLA